jgi:hypothetical protein
MNNFDKICGRELGIVLSILVGLIVITIIISPAVVYSALLGRVSVYTISPYDCDSSDYSESSSFPASTLDYYEKTYGFVNISSHTDWYLGDWKAYPYKRGLCPIDAAVRTTNVEGLYVVSHISDRYCIRNDNSLSSAVFENVDRINRDSYQLDSNMADGYNAFNYSGDYILAGTIVTWITLVIGICLAPTVEYHAGWLVIINVLLWLIPGLIALIITTTSDLNEEKFWIGFFPGCSVTVETSLSPGTMLLYYQVVSLSFILVVIISFGSWTFCCKLWTNDDEDISEITFAHPDDSYVYRQVPFDDVGTFMHSLEGNGEDSQNRNKLEMFTCIRGHPCKTSFGLPESYNQENKFTVNNTRRNISCFLCRRPNIDFQELYAYFIFCERCHLNNNQNHIEEANETAPKSNDGHQFNVCMVCVEEWKQYQLNVVI